MSSSATETQTLGEPKKPRFTPFQLILMSLGLGVAVGLFVGEYAAPLDLIGDIYIGLLQMTVLPYIIFSVIGNIGHLTIDRSKKIALTSFTVLFILWGVGLAVVFLMAQALPQTPSGSFFSTSLIAPPPEFDFLAIFIPSNPFRSLSENLVPGVVLFSIMVGFALMQSPTKQTTLAAFNTMNDTLGRVTNYITKLSPIGIFAIAASATGTITLEEFGRLQAYLLIYVLGSLLLTVVVLPMMVAAVTPFRYRDILATQGNVLVTAFAIGSVFAVIPMLVESHKRLVEMLPTRGVDADPKQLSDAAEFIIPLAYPFPHLGKIVTLIFIPFAAWFYGQPMDFLAYPQMLTTGLFLSFGKVTVTIPFLLDLQKIPADIFRLMLMSSVIAGRFSDLLGAAHLLAFTSLTTCAMAGLVSLRRIKVVGSAALILGVTVLTVVVSGQVLNRLFMERFDKDNVIATMQLLQDSSPSRVLAVSEPNPDQLLPGETAADRIRRRNTLRFGFDPDNLPFSYYNADGVLVGYDIELAHKLAKDFELALEFVPISRATLTEQVQGDHVDIAASGLEINPRFYQGITYSLPYMTVNFAFVVRDHERDDFADTEILADRDDLTIGVKAGSSFARTVRAALPNARIVDLWSESQFFEGPPVHLDALVTTAQGGSAWTLIHPNYAVVTPHDIDASVPIAFIMARENVGISDGFETWLRLQQHDGTLEDLYNYWILGKGVETSEARWSVIRNVLHWVD